MSAEESSFANPEHDQQRLMAAGALLMAVFRLFIASILLTRELSRREPPPVAVAYDPSALASRLLPSGLRLYRHPREIRSERVREITGGRIG